MGTYSIRQIINKVQNGEIRIPAFQRDYVWEHEDVAYLLDSIYKKFPIGTLFFWRTREKLNTEKQLGDFILPEPQESYPIDYVLDGQQRITSLFTVFQTELKSTVSSEIDIYFILEEVSSIQKSKFVALPKSDVDTKKYFPISALFDPVLYRKATEGYSDEIIIKIDKLQEVFKECAIPYELLETDNKEHVAIVFERINHAGVPLNSFQLFTAWSWSSSFDLQDRLSTMAEELDDYGFGEIINQKDILLKCFTGIILKNTSPSAVFELEGNLIRENFEKIENGIKSSIDFMQKEFGIMSYKMMPFPSMLIPLTAFFASEKKNGQTLDDIQRAKIVKWFWRCCFSRRYSSGVNDAQETDIKNLLKLKENNTQEISDFKCNLTQSFFKENQFSVSAANTKTFILLLLSKTPRSFISGMSVDLSKTLKAAFVREFHHIFPDKYLQRNGYVKKDIFCLSNFCFLNNADNQKIKDRAPSDYKKDIVGDMFEIMSSALCPENALDLSYEEFIEKRTNILLEYAEKLIQ